MKYAYSQIDLNTRKVTLLGSFLEGDQVFCRRTGRLFKLTQLVEEGLAKKIFFFYFLDEEDRISDLEEVPKEMLPYWFKEEDTPYEPEFNSLYSFEDVPPEDIPEWV